MNVKKRAHSTPIRMAKSTRPPNASKDDVVSWKVKKNFRRKFGGFLKTKYSYRIVIVLLDFTQSKQMQDRR